MEASHRKGTTDTATPKRFWSWILVNYMPINVSQKEVGSKQLISTLTVLESSATKGTKIYVLQRHLYLFKWCTCFGTTFVCSNMCSVDVGYSLFLVIYICCMIYICLNWLKLQPQGFIQWDLPGRWWTCWRKWRPRPRECLKCRTWSQLHWNVSTTGQVIVRSANIPLARFPKCITTCEEVANWKFHPNGAELSQVISQSEPFERAFGVVWVDTIYKTSIGFCMIGFFWMELGIGKIIVGF